MLPAPGPADAEYVVVVVSTNGQESQSGTSGTYFLRTGQPSPSSGLSALIEDRVPTLPEAFHTGLRQREAQLAEEVRPADRPRPFPVPGAAAPPPVVGTQRTFKACAVLSCTSFTDVPATARYVGTKVAVYLDNAVPTADPYLPADLDELGRTFDQYHYPIDTDAFGAESDIDQNSVVIILLTDAVNALTPNCTNGRVLGFFAGGDLLPTTTGSNGGEIFYALVPAPASSGCTALSRQSAKDAVKATLIHEFQHMISFNQHVLMRQGQSERVWLNEGLSHFAEELGGRLIPNAECVPFNSCRSLYTSGDLINAYDYLEDTEAHFLVSPSSSTGTLEERGAGWLFVRWIADQFAADPILGASVTRALVQTVLTGEANVQAVTATPMATLIPEWHLANYLDDLAGFTPTSTRISYVSWGFRQVFAQNAPPNGTVFPRAFPMTPDVITAPSSYARNGTLRAGSGRTLRVLMPAGAAALSLQLLRNASGLAIETSLRARFGIARLR